MARKLWVAAVTAVILASMTFGVTAAGAADSSNNVVKGMVYVGSDDERIIALDATTGLIRWTTNIQGVDSSPTVVKGVVYVDSDEGFIYALDAWTGEILWVTEIPDP